MQPRTSWRPWSCSPGQLRLGHARAGGCSPLPACTASWQRVPTCGPQLPRRIKMIIQESVICIKWQTGGGGVGQTRDCDRGMPLRLPGFGGTTENPHWRFPRKRCDDFFFVTITPVKLMQDKVWQALIRMITWVSSAYLVWRALPWHARDRSANASCTANCCSLRFNLILRCFTWALLYYAWELWKLEITHVIKHDLITPCTK